MVVETAEKLISALGDIGIPASIDPPALKPPCARIAAQKLRARDLHGGFQIEFDIYLIARDTGIPESIRVLDSMLFDVVGMSDTHDFEITDTSLGEAVTLPAGGGRYPPIEFHLLLTKIAKEKQL